MKTSQKSLLYMIGAFLLFGCFIYLLIKPSLLTRATKEIGSCMNSEDVKTVWYKYRADLNEEEDFKQAVRTKLQSFSLSKTEIADIKKWLPPKTQNLNIILVPDLSHRITDEKNNADQLQHDTALLQCIWVQFEKNVRLKMNSKDRLMVDIADPAQGQGQFRTIADSLVFDLSEVKNKSNRIYFSGIAGNFSGNIAQLYDLAKQKPTGADYAYYFFNSLPQRLKKSTLDDDYRNVIILLTDGYLEINKTDGSVRSISPDAAALRRYAATGNSASFQYPTQTLSMSYPDAEIYLLEVNERKSGQGCDFVGLKKWWTEWFKNMQVKNAGDEFIFRRDNAIKLSEKNIQAIFDVK